MIKAEHYVKSDNINIDTITFMNNVFITQDLKILILHNHEQTQLPLHIFILKINLTNSPLIFKFSYSIQSSTITRTLLVLIYTLQ